MGCVKMGLKIDPFFLNCIHLVPGFNCVLEYPHPVNNRVGDVGHLYMVVQGSSNFPLFYDIFYLIEDCVNGSVGHTTLTWCSVLGQSGCLDRISHM